MCLAHGLMLFDRHIMLGILDFGRANRMYSIPDNLARLQVPQVPVPDAAESPPPMVTAQLTRIEVNHWNSSQLRGVHATR
jgi:hypothetical protein